MHTLFTPSPTPPDLLLHLKSPSPFFSPTVNSLKPDFKTTKRLHTITCCASKHAAVTDIDMVRNRQGIYSAKPKRVVVLWDLDNKPPRGPPYQAAMALIQLAQCFGHVVDISAYANRHAFIHLPQWVREERSQRKQVDILERKGMITPSEPYVCNVCGRKCRTNLDLKKHFKQLHEREREKKLSRMRSLKGKKRQKYKERFISGNTKYEEGARNLLSPKVGYGLASELRRAGVFVKMVEDKPQSADRALKRQMQHSMSRGIDWMFLVTDDSDFSDMLRSARESNLQTVVVGDSDRALGRNADLWVPWLRVENGEIGEEELFSARTERDEFSHMDNDGGLFSFTEFDEDSDYESDLDQVVDELVGTNSHVKISAFSEGEEMKRIRGKFGKEDTDSHVTKSKSSLLEDDLFWDSDEEDDFL
ncbi:hypothetical protein IFM89_024556 [Coptis chinensis]|uniref:C2H2-type domain-containing protein n=1 Tax=Coptis chinensis TaxID=261450 RepID=A0A835M713_9MAGN|nr:hypothetical protein IFM89_024556 [Coptis chinensis]